MRTSSIKNESLLAEFLPRNSNDTILDIGGETGMIVGHILAKTSCKEACIAELEYKKLYYASSAVASFKKKREKNDTL
jgi:tRNA1(Val) A37 N6-methylase TrmN6